tara:strand:- start:553 stop:1599 length:1047 start_codon:yes stop_codon:yes gene_type:complete
LKKVNIIIPSKKISHILTSTLKKLKKQTLKNIIVTIVIDNKNYKKKFLYGKNIKIVPLNGSKNMSVKRNYAAKLVKSEYLAFLDSDAFPENKNWLSNGVKYLEKYKKDNVVICGGPDVSPKLESTENKISGILDKSYFISGFRNYRKSKKKNKFVKQLASCNMFISRSDYLSYGGMKESLYTGEDADLCNRVIINKKKIYYHPSISVIHLNRSFKAYLIQRIDRSHEAARATKEFFLGLFKKNFKGSYKIDSFRYEFLINPILSIYILFYFFNYIFLVVNELIAFIPFLIFFILTFLESIRLTKKIKYFLHIFFKLNITIFVQSFANLYFLFLKDNFIKKKYVNQNDK